jgi:hypothetical protein
MYSMLDMYKDLMLIKYTDNARTNDCVLGISTAKISQLSYIEATNTDMNNEDSPHTSSPT